jgi:transcriptional regulator with XRE-family HTH domain
MNRTLRYPVDDRNGHVTARFAPTVGSTAQNGEMGIGRRLKERRVELGLSVKQVADAAGMAPTTLYDLEREEQHSTTRLHALGRVLGLNPEWADSGHGPRLAGSPTAPVQLVDTDQKSTGATVDMANVARDVLEIALLIAATAEPFRSQLIALARSLPKVDQPASPGSAPDIVRLPGSDQPDRTKR